MRIRPKNWAKFQHYRDRNPPWIKLHRDILNDRAFMLLATCARALAPMLWLLASESEDGSLSGDHVEIAFRLRARESEVKSGLDMLLRAGFFEVCKHDASNVLHVATSETETETETDRRASARRSPPERPSDVPEQTWADWQTHRKAIKAPITATAIAGFRREAERAGVTLEVAIAHSVAQGWRGFRADWFLRDAKKPAEPMRNAPSPFKPAAVMVFHEPGNNACPCDKCAAQRRRAT